MGFMIEKRREKFPILFRFRKGLLDHVEQFPLIIRLRNKIVGPFLHGLNGCLNISITRNHNDRSCRLLSFTKRQQVHPAFTRHLQVCQDQVQILLFDDGKGGVHIVSDEDAER